MRLRTTLVLGALLGLPCSARAQTCPVSTDVEPAPALGRLEPRERLAFIDQSMAAGVGPARLHTYGWGALQAGSMAVNGTLLFFASEKTQPDRAVALATSTVGLAATIISYPAVLGNHRIVAGLASPDASAPPGSECQRLGEAERLLVETARDEQRKRSWFRHVLNVAFNGAMALVLGVGYGRWSAAALQAGPLVIGEAILFTRPTTASAALERYRAGELARSHAASPTATFGVHLTPASVGFGGTF